MISPRQAADDAFRRLTGGDPPPQMVPQPPEAPTPSPPVNPARGELAKTIFAGGAVPMTEVYNRIYQGRNIDLDRIENAVRWADTGVMAPLTDLSRETVRNDPHLASLLLKRFGNIRTVDWDLIAASGTGIDENRAREIADATRSALRRVRGLRQGFYDLAWGRFDGRAALETDWAFAGGRHPWMPTALHRIHPARLSFGPERELRVVERFRQTGYFHPTGPALRDIPGKFIWDVPSLFSDYQEREGLAPPSLYWSFFKRFSWRHRMVLTELFGIPWRIVEADKDAPPTPDGLAASLTAAESLGGTTAAAFPNGHRMRLEAPHPESGTLFSMTSGEVNAELSKLITLQTSLTEGDSNRASAVVATSQQDIVFELDGNDIADRFQQQLVDVFVELNYGAEALSHTPSFTLRTAPQRDRKADLERVEKVLSFGVPVAEAEIREISGLRKPASGEPTIDMLPSLAPPPGTPPAGDDGPGGGPGLDAAEEDAELATGAPAVAAALPAVPKVEAPAPAPVTASLSDAAAAKLAAAMTEDQTPRCEHGKSNRCRLCGIERTRELIPSTTPGAGDHKWKIGWQPIGAASTEPDDDPDAEGELTAERVVRELLAWDATGDGRPAGGRPPFGLGGSSPQPATIHGSPDAIVDRGVAASADLTGQWAAAFVEVVDALPPAGPVLHAGLAHMADRLDVRALAETVFCSVLHGLMLGALDANHEVTHAEADDGAPAKLDHGLVPAQGPEHLIPPGGRGVKDFVATPFAEAVRDFANRDVIPRDQFLRLAGEARRKAFTVAGLAKQDMLATAHDELSKALAKGPDLGSFSKSLAKRFDAAGWTPLNPSHVENIFRTNTMSAYGNGRRALMTQPAVLRAMPYWLIRGVDDSRTRPSHKAAHGKVVLASDPFWQKASPPFGFQCRCRCTALTAAQVKRRGLPVVDGSSLDLPDEGFDAEPMIGAGGGGEAPEAPPHVERPPREVLHETSGADDDAPTERTTSVPGAVGPVRHEREVPGLGKVVSDVSTEHADAVVRAANKAGIGRVLERAPLRRFEITADPRGPSGRPLSGRYFRGLGVAEVRGARGPETWGETFVPGESWTVSNGAASELEAVERTAAHELAHHVHEVGGPLVDKLIQEAFVAARANGVAISGHALAHAHFDYFAETFTASIYEPDALAAHDPRGLALVRMVRRMLGI